MTNYCVGVDVASFQGAPRWTETFDAGYRFAYVKTTQYPHYLNPYAAEQRHDAYHAGFKVGNYCYAVAKLGDPIGQANLFLAKSDLQPWHLIPFLDLEEIGSEGVSPKGLEDFAYRWGKHVADSLGVRNLMIYTDLNMLRSRVYQSKRLRDLYLLDIADWTLGPPPTVPGWRVALHQYDTSRGAPGFSGPVDRNRALVPLESLTIHAQREGLTSHVPEPPRDPKWKHPSWWIPHQ